MPTKFKVSLHKGGDVFSCTFIKVGNDDNYGNTEYHFNIGMIEHTWGIKNSDQRAEILSRMAPGTPFSIQLKDTGKAYPYATVLTDGEVPKVAPPAQQTYPTQVSGPAAEQKKDVDWNAVARGKTKCAISEAFIRAGSKKLTPAIQADILEFVDFIMQK